MRRLLLPMLALLLAGAPAVAADAIFPPGSRIGLVPPARMKLAQGMAGFQDPGTGAAILTVEMPAAAYPSIASGFTDEALKSQGFTLKARETPKVGNTTAILISGDQNESGRAIPKTVLIASEPSMTALVIAQLPPGASAADQDEVRAALKTVTFRAPLTMDEQLAALPFKIGDYAGFRTLRVMAGNSLLLTNGPNDQITNADQPVVIVAQSFVPAPPLDQRDAFARALLASNTMLKDIAIERSQPFRQSGSEWHEIVAKAKDGPSDTPVIVMQTIRFEPGSYTRMIGITRTENRDTMLPRFRRMVDTLALK